MKHLIAAAFCVITAAPAFAEKLPLNEISRYLNAMKTAQGEFTQINDDGTLTTGDIYIKRPGRVRFEYDPPDRALVIAGAGAVVIFDPKSNQAPETYALNRTPLSIILARNVDLGRANMVTGHNYDGTATIVRAQDPDNPDTGNIELMFTGSPTQLRKWVINDANGGQTTVILGGLETGMSLGDGLFNTQLVGEGNGR